LWEHNIAKNLFFRQISHHSNVISQKILHPPYCHYREFYLHLCMNLNICINKRGTRQSQ
jgi:hypothetical protein